MKDEVPKGFFFRTEKYIWVTFLYLKIFEMSSLYIF